ncbi:flagellar basal body-associated FliL family protein [Macromonas nakdongensis]|jgi:flagellar FliL protein|uniref:flagellar basal body-associated FliL family protein n=1 Tax=Macromonas nakdongensis TaxID=1843082 RepID=UPI000C338D07|nr:flagellar basal body-associated FliL family protein [Macromonas nakdongensis]
MAAKPAAGADNAEKPKSKKMLVIVLVAVLLLVVAGAAAAFLLLKPSADEEDGGDAHAAAETTKHAKPKAPPQYMPLDALVINLADPGGMRYAQVGITLQLEDAATGEAIKGYLPTIRNGILMQISRRTADELLRPEGKEALMNDILTLVREEAGMPLNRGHSPVQAVLFSSLIVQ